MTIAFFIGLILFTAYVIVAVVKFGVPKSLSDTFYLYGGKPKGYVFTAALWLTALLLGCSRFPSAMRPRMRIGILGPPCLIKAFKRGCREKPLPA